MMGWEFKTFLANTVHNSGRKVVIIITLFIMISMVLTLIIFLQGKVFEGVRSYIRGEGLWAKAQQHAVSSLIRYTYTANPKQLEQFYESIKVNLGDKRARLALSREEPDDHIAFQGFVAGNNDPRDIESMIWFFHNFQNIYYLKKAISIWEAADNKISELITIADRLQAINGRVPSDIETLRMQIDALNRELIVLENRFSAVLGEGARWVKRTIWYATLAILLLFVTLAVWISRQIIRGIQSSEEKLRESEMRFSSLFESNTIGIVSWRMDGVIDDANSYVLNMLGYQVRDMHHGGLNWKRLTPRKWEQRDQQAIYELLSFGRCEPYEKEFITSSGELIPIYIGASLIDTYRDRGMAYIIDLRERKKIEAAQRLSAAVFEVSHDGILITNPNFHILSMNRAMELLTGFNARDLHGDAREIFESSDFSNEKYQEIYSQLVSEGFWQGDVLINSKHGRGIPVHVAVSAVVDDAGQPTNFVATFADITERKIREARLDHMAHHDALTGLANRSYLEERIEEAIGHAQNEQSHFALLFFDLDKFKPINDTYGHETGDMILKCVADRLSHHTRRNDTVARIGGDEFVILLEGLKERSVAEKIAGKTVTSVCNSCKISEELSLEIQISVGISFYPDDGSDVHDLLHHADSAMYAMKKDSR